MSHNHRKVLVIEDEPEMLRNIVTILEMEGFTTVQAGNGRRGVELARTELPNLVLCDMMMPELDGHGVIDALRAHEATVGIPFIFLTARAEKGDVRTGMNLGADDYLTKPVDADELLKAIHARLERHDEKVDAALAQAEFTPNFSSAKPLEALGLTPREAEVLFWIAQGKSNLDISIILGAAEGTVRKHIEHIFEKLGVESRNAATLCAIEILSARATSRASGEGRNAVS